MHFSQATIVAALAAGVLATPVPQIGGEAQACQGIVSGVTDGVGGATKTILDKVAGAKRWTNLYRRQGAGLSNACYDVVNNVDQGIGYTTGDLMSGIAGDPQDQVKGSAAVGNTNSAGGSSSGPPPAGAPKGPGGPGRRRRQVGDVAEGVQAVADKAGLGSATSGVTSGLENAVNEVNSVETEVGATAGTLEASPDTEASSAIGNEIYDAAHGDKASSNNNNNDGGNGGGNGGAPAPPAGGPGGPPPPHKRQLNKIATGEQDLTAALGLGEVDYPLYEAENTIDGDGTSGVGNAGKAVGNAIDSTLNGVANAA